jgi:hypothetical protein
VAEPYITQLRREREVLADALSAVIDWSAAMDRAENSVFKHDAIKDAQQKREIMRAKINAALPLIQGGKNE